MPTITIPNTTPNDFKPNLYTRKVLFQNENTFDYVVNSGTGTIERYTNLDNPTMKLYGGHSSIKVNNTDYQNTDLVFSSPSGLDSFITSHPKNHHFQFSVLNASGAIDTTLEIEVFQDGSTVQVYKFELNSTTMPTVEKFYTFSFEHFFDTAFEYTFKWTLKAQATGATTKTIYIAGLCITMQNTQNEFCPYYSLPQAFEWFVKETITIPVITSHDYELTEVVVDSVLVGDVVTFADIGIDFLNSNLHFQQPTVKENGVVWFKTSNVNSGSSTEITEDVTLKIIR